MSKPLVKTEMKPAHNLWEFPTRYEVITSDI